MSNTDTNGPEVDWPENHEALAAWQRIRQAAREMAPGKSIAAVLSAADDFGVSCANAARKPLADEQIVALFVELNSSCAKADSPTEMFSLIVRAVERVHGIA